MIFNQWPASPGARFWISVNVKTQGVYVFVLTQSLTAPGVWGTYAAVWSNVSGFIQTQIFGPRPPGIPKTIAGSPFATYGEAIAACQAQLDLLP